MGINFFSKSYSVLVIDNENKSHLLWQSLVRLFEIFTGVTNSYAQVQKLDLVALSRFLSLGHQSPPQLAKKFKTLQTKHGDFGLF